MRITGVLRDLHNSVTPGADGSAYVHFTLSSPGQTVSDVRGRRLFGTGRAAQVAATAATRRLKRGLPVTVHAAAWAVDKDLGQLVLVGVNQIDQGTLRIPSEVEPA